MATIASRKPANVDQGKTEVDHARRKSTAYGLKAQLIGIISQLRHDLVWYFSPSNWLWISAIVAQYAGEGAHKTVTVDSMGKQCRQPNASETVTIRIGGRYASPKQSEYAKSACLNGSRVSKSREK